MMTRPALFLRLDHAAWAMGAGVLLALSMPPVGLFPLAWVALVPLLARWSRLRHGWTLFREAYVTFLLMAVGAGFWVLFHRAMGAALLSGLGLLLVPLPHAAAFALSALVRKRYGLLAGLLALACNVLAAEYLVAHLPGGLPWLLLGHTQAAALPFIQIADLGGVGMLTLFVLVLNGLAFAFVCTAPRAGLLPGGRTLLALLGLALLSGVAAYGDGQVAALSAPDGELDVVVVQPAEPAHTWANALDWQRVERLAALSDRAAAVPAAGDVRPVADGLFPGNPTSPHLLLWPEAALPLLPDAGAQERLYRRLGIWTVSRHTALLTGALTREDPGRALYNAAVFIQGDAPPQQYEKVHLTPFVERVPLLSTNPLLEAVTLPEAGFHLASGSAPGLFDAGRYKAGAVIGFESLRGDYVRRLAAGGANVLVTLAEEGWWGRSPGGRQHLTLTRLRAVETRRAVVMATVSGTSAVVYPDGQIEPLAGWMEQEVAQRAVPLQSEATLYTREGDWPGRFALWGAGWLLLAWGVAAAFFRPPARPRKRPRA